MGDLEHRQVGADHRVEKPLLAERVGAEALDVGHVAVKDDRQVAGGLPRPAPASGTADGEEIERRVEVSGPQA